MLVASRVFHSSFQKAVRQTTHWMLRVVPKSAEFIEIKILERIWSEE